MVFLSLRLGDGLVLLEPSQSVDACCGSSQKKVDVGGETDHTVGSKLRLFKSSTRVRHVTYVTVRDPARDIRQSDFVTL
jgi:hypothetical protein